MIPEYPDWTNRETIYQEVVLIEMEQKVAGQFKDWVRETCEEVEREYIKGR